MSKYRRSLPQMNGKLCLTDGGLETTLVFIDGIELPCFAAFDMLKDDAGGDHLKAYYERYITIALKRGTGFILEAPTWRANPDWVARVGYHDLALGDVNRKAIGLMLELRETFETPQTPIVISGNLGPRGDGYVADRAMSADQASAYHATQIEIFAGTDADMICALTLNYVEEAIGIARAARDAVIPAAISFTVETDGRLPTGQPLGEAIEQTDAATDSAPDYYLINCAHPTHFEDALRSGGRWRERILGIRANASRCSHAELDESTELDDGDPIELSEHYRALRELLPNLSVLGGCCGTDHRHVEAVSEACLV